RVLVGEGLPGVPGDRMRLALWRFVSIVACSIVLVAAAAPVVGGAGEVAAGINAVTQDVPSALAATPVPLVTTVTARDGTPLALWYEQYRLPVTFAQISVPMRQAIVSI